MFYLELFLGFFFLWSKGIILLFTYIIHNSTLVQKKLCTGFKMSFSVQSLIQSQILGSGYFHWRFYSLVSSYLNPPIPRHHTTWLIELHLHRPNPACSLSTRNNSTNDTLPPKTHLFSPACSSNNQDLILPNTGSTLANYNGHNLLQLWHKASVLPWAAALLTPTLTGDRNMKCGFYNEKSNVW